MTHEDIDRLHRLSQLLAVGGTVPKGVRLEDPERCAKDAAALRRLLEAVTKGGEG